MSKLFVQQKLVIKIIKQRPSEVFENHKKWDFFVFLMLNDPLIYY